MSAQVVVAAFFSMNFTVCPNKNAIVFQMANNQQFIFLI